MSDAQFRQGFCRLPNEVLLDPELRTRDLAVYWAVRSFIYGEKTRWAPSYAAVAKRASCSKKSARESVRRLEHRGWLIVCRPKPTKEHSKPGRPAHVLELVKNREAFLRGRERRDEDHAQRVRQDGHYEAVQVQARTLRGEISRDEANALLQKIDKRMARSSPRVPVAGVSKIEGEETGYAPEGALGEDGS
jgi:hypothetical protein